MDYPYRLSLHVYMDDVMDPIQHRLIKGCRYYTFGGGGGGGGGGGEIKNNNIGYKKLFVFFYFGESVIKYSMIPYHEHLPLNELSGALTQRDLKIPTV